MTPAGWDSIPLRELGVEIKKSVKPSPGVEYEMYSVPAFQTGEPEILLGEEIRSSKRDVQREDLLLCKINPRINRVWWVDDPSGGRPQLASSEYLVLRLHEQYREMLRYLVWYLRSPEFRRWIELNVEGATGSHTRAKSATILQQNIPIAPKHTRDALVHAIEKQWTRADTGRAALHRSQSMLMAYRTSLLEAAFRGALSPTREAKAHKNAELGERLLEQVLRRRQEDWTLGAGLAVTAVGRGRHTDSYKAPTDPDLSVPIDVPPGWAVASLEQVTHPVRVICYGILMPKQDVEDGVPYVKVKDMKGDRVSLSSLQRTAPGIAAKYQRSALKPRDILLAIRGTYGRVVLVPDDLDGANITQDTARLDPSELIDASYLMWYLRSPAAQSFFARVARGVAVKGVNIRDVKRTPVLLPPLEEQRMIAEELSRRISIIDELHTEIALALKRSERLKEQVLHHAFSGTLRFEKDAA